MSQSGVLTVKSGGGSTTETFTGNSGGAVGPDGLFNINLLGNNSSGINIVGNPGTNTLTVTAYQATTSQEGTVTLATNAQAIAGTDAANALTSAALAAKLGTQTAHSLALFEGSTSALVPLGVATNGQIPIGSIGANPVLGNITSSGGTITVTNGAGTINLDVVGGAGIDTINGDFHTISGSTIKIDAGFATRVCGSMFFNGISATELQLNLFDGFGNMFIGYHAGVGAIAGSLNNTSLGSATLNALTTGTYNLALGYGALSILLTGSYNIAVGFNAGEGYGGAESSNISIGNIGVTNESNVIRIGTQGAGNGQQNKCFIAGIEGVSVSNVNYVTINTSTGQLGSVSSITSPLTVTSVNHAASSYTVLSTDQFIACQTSTGIITILLPNAPTTGRVFYIKDSNGAAATSNITVTTVGGGVSIDGPTTYTMATNYQAISLVFDGSQYEVF